MGALSSHLERHQSDSPIPSKRPSSRSETSESLLSSKRPRTAEKSAAEQMYQCPYCKFTNTDLNRLRMHVMTQHSVQPMLRCPLCQDMLNNKIHLQFHLTHLHSVAPDCVDKLIATVTATEVLPASMFVPVPSPDRESQGTPHATANSNSEDTKKQADASDADPEKGVSLPTEIAEARKSPLEDQQSERDDATGFLCWKKGCNQVFKSSNSLQMHFNEVHNKRPQLPVSDRHVYKKGPNFTMEKFLDPSRPFKCTVCKESFTQKNILLVHYNSVSHLHKVKRALQESTTGQPEPTSSPDNKPFKCSTCNVAYSQSSTLEIHMRSVLHQTKARAAKLEAAGGITSSASAPGLSGGVSTTTSSPSPATNSTTSSTNHSSSGSQTTQSILGGNHMSQSHCIESLGNSSVSCRSSPSENHEPPVPMAQIPMPMDLPLFSPLMMQPMSLQSLPTQLPPQLPSVEPSLASDLAQLYQQQLTPAMLQQQQNKRPRTRITDDQLRVLRQYFDINNSPNEEQIKEMADKSGLPQKVIKHWFRNTLFKERQRNKDSPYNFNNPPTTTLEDTKIDSKPPSPEPQKQELYGSKRSSRTRFTDYQLRVLQDFFDANAYPKDDEFEQLSNLLSLPTRVIVVWFQNARQKARKNYENQGEGGKDGERRELSNDRYIRTSNLNYQCKKCSLVFQRIFDLIKHQKKLCYKDEDEDGQYDSQNEDSLDLSHECYTPSGSSCHTPMPSSSSLCPLPPSTSAFSHLPSAEKEEASPASTSTLYEEKPKQLPEISADPRENQTSIKQEITNSDGQSSSMSPVNKGMDLSPRALLSPSSIKVEGMEDFESATMSSVNLSFDQSKLDNDDCSSVNTAITDTTTGDEANADNDSADAKHSQNSGDYLPKSGGSAPILENDDQMSSGLVSPATSYYAKDYENENMIDHSETSSLADPCSPSPGASGSRSIDSGDRPGQKRFRTQMTNLQLKVLKSCFNDYRTPTMLECEVLGNEIGLPKRVVQVWFQNARAKEKKAKLNMAKHFGINQTSYEGPKTECTLCGVKYSARLSVRDHIFSQQHISKVKDTIGSQIDKEKEYFDPATVRQLMAQQEMDRIKKANEVLGLAQQQAMQQQGMFDNPAMQALNLQSAYPNLQGIPPVLLPGVGSPSLSSFNSSNSALTPPKPSNLLNMPGASVPSPSLPTSGLPNKPPSSSSLAASSPAQTNTSASHSSPTSSTSNSTSSTAQSGSRPEPPKERDAERVREKEKPKEKTEKPPTPSSTGSTPAPSTSAASAKKEKPDTAVPATSMPTPGMEYVVDPAQLQALQAALASDPTALLTNQFLPYFMPGFSPYYTPQIPGALQGGYLQPMYGMESLFPYNPALSQALMGLSPGSLLQHYQQYQQSLQEALQQQQRQLQQIQQPKASQTPVPSQSLGDRKESAKDPVKTEEQKGNPHSEPSTSSSSSSSSSSSHNKVPSEQNEMDGKAVDPLVDQYIVPKVQYKLACRKCQAVFTKEEAAITHLKSNCFFGQSVANLQEMLLRVPGGVGAGAGSLYDCLACDTT
ncbi:zinc finger homeobox protein 3 isoform X1, partial [Lates japonicus]